MFKNFLSYHFVDAFARECCALELPASDQHSLQRCSREVWIRFHRSLQTTDSKERSSCLFVAMTYLEDCKEILEKHIEESHPLWIRHAIIQGRLVDLFEKSSKKEGGQLRMFG
jgi:hypothetical protein